MKNMLRTTALIALVAASLSGCDKPPAMPEVNDANCQFEEIMKIKDKTTRETFAGLCSHRPVGPDTLPSKPMRW